MRNPVFTKEQAFAPASSQQPQQPYQQPGYPQNAPYGYQQTPYQNVQTPATQLMTLDDVITKSAIVMGVLMITAMVSMRVLMPTILAGNLVMLGSVMAISGIASFVAVLVVSMRRSIKPAFVLAYSVLEGIFIGSFSAMFEVLYPGIVTQAVLATFVTAGIVLAAYKFFNIRATPKFRKIVFIGTLSFAGVVLVNMVLSFFLPVNLYSFTGIGLIISLVAVVLACMNLIMDFDYIERGVANAAPASESWRAAWGLTVTMVWLYTEILRILYYLQDN